MSHLMKNWGDVSPQREEPEVLEGAMCNGESSLLVRESTPSLSTG